MSILTKVTLYSQETLSTIIKEKWKKVKCLSVHIYFLYKLTKYIAFGCLLLCIARNDGILFHLAYRLYAVFFQELFSCSPRPKC